VERRRKAEFILPPILTLLLIQRAFSHAYSETSSISKKERFEF
jgi:hypothetical protein